MKFVAAAVLGQRLRQEIDGERRGFSKAGVASERSMEAAILSWFRRAEDLALIPCKMF
jgi:hypothetical protein